MIKRMKQLFARIGVLLLLLWVASSGIAQDLIARQAPVDKKLKAVDSLALVIQIKTELTEFPAFDIYPSWNKKSVHTYEGAKVPDSYIFNLSGFHMPTPNTRVTSKFGPRGRRMHNGIDVKVQIGDTIYAAFDGKVRMVRNQGRRVGYGRYVVIRHPNGLETVYGHLSKQLVAEDQLVRAGEPIGLGGNTGRSFGSHLHFETLFLGIPINPAFMFDFPNQDIVADTFTFNYSKSARKSDVVSGDGTIYHRVRRGDTLSRIASQRGVSINTLCRLNGIKRTSILRIGQVLRCS
jgi:murein DD-endopeptidase MepM/ murein hydrolase activator NlpD